MSSESGEEFECWPKRKKAVSKKKPVKDWCVIIQKVGSQIKINCYGDDKRAHDQAETLGKGIRELMIYSIKKAGGTVKEDTNEKEG